MEVTKITRHTACQHCAIQWRGQNFEVCMNVKVTTLGSLWRSFCIKVERRTASTGCFWSWGSLEQSTDVRAAADAVRILMKTSTQLSCCCWVKKTNLRATKQSERRGSIGRQFRGLFTKICISKFSIAARTAAQQLAEALIGCMELERMTTFTNVGSVTC